ncbi:LuxR C-terminal-related transcriptional regulator [Streptomyces sp. NPDC015127]|uniref:LuxR C-terminal-related transcriptional regulator n=1 Tax=Streptomyces sp. NPDC015127 TaxID=3364939 RepID=UPI0036FB45EB
MASTDTLLELEQAGLIALDDSPADASRALARSNGSRISISNPLIACGIRQLQKPLRRRAHIRELIDVYSRDPNGLADEDQLRLLAWRAEVSPGELTESDLLFACQLAHSRNDLHAAADFSYAAWMKYKSPKAASLFARISISLGNHSAACAIADEAPDDADELQAIAARGLMLQCMHRDAETRFRHLTEVEQNRCQGILMYLRGDYRGCIDHLSKYLSDEDPSHRLEAAVFVSASLCGAGRPEDALDICEQLQNPADSNRSTPFLLYAEHLEDMRCIALAQLGRLDEAARFLSTEYNRSLSGSNSHSDARRGLFLGETLLEMGLPRTALEYLSLSDAYSTGWEVLEWKGRVLELLARHLLPGEWVVEAPGMEVLAGDGLGHLSSNAAVVNAWQEVSNSKFNQAAEILLTEAGSQMRRQAYGEVARLVHEMGRLGFSHHTTEFWEIPLQGSYLGAKVGFAKAIASSDVSLLRRAAATFASCGANLYAAEAYAELSRLYTRLGNDRASTAARQQAASLSSRCEGAVTPALRMLAEVNHLSAREREIAGLVSRGLSDKEIADALILSPRTVGNHLYRIYRKIGVADRRELRARWGKIHL